jgi:tetratricopeptide (TPR) repeat protein
MSDGSRFAALILTLAGFWRETQHLRELRSLLARALDELRPEEQELETRCRCWLGLSLIALGELDRAREALELSVAWWRGRGVNDDRDLAVALLGLGTVDLEQAAVEGAESLFLEARDVASRAGADGVVLSATGNLATVAERRGDDARAVELFTSVVESARRQGDVASEAWALSNIGLLSHESGALELAERSLWESLELFDRLGWVEGLAYSLTGLAAVALELGDEARALKLAGAAEGLAESIGLGWQGAERELRDRVRAAIRESLGDSFEEVWATAVQGDAGATVAGEIARLPSRSH